MSKKLTSLWSRFLGEYGMLFVLLLLCVFYSYQTLKPQFPEGAGAADQITERLLEATPRPTGVVIAAKTTEIEAAFADALAEQLQAAGIEVHANVKGQPVDLRETLERLVDEGKSIDVVAASKGASAWKVYEPVKRAFPSLKSLRVETVESYYGSSFLKTDNLLNVATQIAVIAILAIGMTLVIITGGIDLSVGSLIALSAVIGTWFVRDWGAENAGTFALFGAGAIAIGVAASIGVFSGLMVTTFGIAPFIVTLAMMLVAKGTAFIISDGESIYQLPDSITWLGRGAEIGIPNSVVLMVTLYAIAHLIMTRTTFGRYVYAVGGNQEAARLSGVPVKRILLIVYTVSGALAGLGGVVLASQLKSGAATYGIEYELQVIAAVVVGGTSLAGGEGRVLGTLIGAFIIGVNQNGMNLIGLGSDPQKVVLGGVILVAVLLDSLRSRGGLLAKLKGLKRHG